MAGLRNLLVNFKVRWENFCHSMKPYLNYGSNRSLDLILICAGIHPIPGPEAWKRRCLCLYRLLGFYQFIMALARVGFSLYNQDDTVGLCASIMLAVGVICCQLKVYALEHYKEVLRQAKNFVDSNFGDSSEFDYDASVRRDSARAAGKVTLMIFLLFCWDQMAMMVPTSARDIIYGLPMQFHLLGPMVCRILQEAFVISVITFWGGRYFSFSLTVMPLVMGLRSELKIVARGYETIQTRVQAQISGDHTNAVGSSSNQLHGLRWKHLKQNLRTTLEQHIEVLRNIQLLENIISVLYAIPYYSSMLIISITFLLVIKNGITLMSVMLLSSSIVMTMECYFWCQLVDSMQEITEFIAAAAAQLVTKLEYSPEHHYDYVQMRTSLMIIQINASQREWFSCGGIFPISMESFGDLCMIVYRGVTFLLNFD